MVAADVNHIYWCWALKNWCFRVVVLEKTLESPLDCKETKTVNRKGNQPWRFLPDAKSWLIGKDPDSGKDWGQEGKRATEDEMVGWLNWLNGHEFQKIPGECEGQGGLVSCSPWCGKKSEMTYWLINNNNWCITHNVWSHFFSFSYVIILKFPK